jgi:polyphenol oxidase
VLPAPFYSLDGQIAIELPGARALFTTRAWGDVREARDAIAERLGLRLAGARQVHGSTVVDAGSVTAETEADALFSTERQLAPVVLTADCLPIAIAGHGTVASIHAGWRGLESGVIANAVRSLRPHSDGAPLIAAIGPGAGACCYEVGPELHARFTGFNVGRNLDLKAIARAQLEQAGVDEVHDSALCTICSDPDLLFSYRRDGAATGRQAAISWLT